MTTNKKARESIARWLRLRQRFGYLSDGKAQVEARGLLLLPERR